MASITPGFPPLRIILSTAPIRIADIGGWTDTWFARHGRVLNIAASPLVEVRIEVFPLEPGLDTLTVCAENFREEFVVDLHGTSSGRHPLLEATIRFMGVPERVRVRVTIFSGAPVGASTGTSAAVCVALIGALDRLRDGQMSVSEISAAARHVETNLLGLESGIQDQISSAFGGINFIEMHEFPEATVRSVVLPDEFLWELERRLVLVYLGRSHSSSEIHEKVIRELENEGPECEKLEDLRAAAARSRDALVAGDFRAFGRSMIENTEAQGRLHRDLVSTDALRVIEIAKAHGAVGWKVNGAGGSGGSLTILRESGPDTTQEMISAIETSDRLFRILPISLSKDGLRVWEGLEPGVKHSGEASSRQNG